ncbi:MAG TPA: HypC/HybG/HupF family hydrogenase formation chaperone [Spirochaetota bacterium]|jgi:hydrogenase expression/formation protein HypC|nr:HypC/HybG/HupF family hydrogenase formation chaperone [Spirochaetota bacterium]HPD05076.1 HypC/HybG/HupF family hydrogenase formation chaperone [Spirochaetota bacterium]HQG42316.1 HypC/HybG/HupF family hydrogenase formation chaperone [Spirochaetota bacterium]HQI37834.1 HypC/HybG/HupF family hydrogenase formation chaperone [Spirochaetota bacterium]HQK07342.1 HypC/HybG/HupF family hydrogenase formation chaperone [Spirochaetota bacterium]
MCLAIPMTVKRIEGTKAVVESMGVEKIVDIALSPDIKINDKVIVHAGFVIEVLDPEAAREIEATWEEYTTLMENKQ